MIGVHSTSLPSLDFRRRPDLECDRIVIESILASNLLIDSTCMALRTGLGQCVQARARFAIRSPACNLAMLKLVESHSKYVEAVRDSIDDGDAWDVLDVGSCHGGAAVGTQGRAQHPRNLFHLQAVRPTERRRFGKLSAARSAR